MNVRMLSTMGCAIACAAAAGHAEAQAAQPLRSYSGCCAFGWAVAELPDVDGDGRRDFAVGANASGQVHLHSSAHADVRWSFTLAGTEFGYALSAVDDVDGDRVADVVAGAPGFQGGGAIRVLSGRTGVAIGGLPAPADTGRFGSAVGRIGDLDGDGAGDFIVGAPGGTGRVLLYSGADGALIAAVVATSPGTEFGAGVAGVRDVDGDRVMDFIVGAPSDAGGRAYLYSGATRALLHTLVPVQPGGRFGEFFVSDAGDVDADGTTDLYVGAYAESNQAGAAYVFSGRDGTRLHAFRGTAREGMGPGRSAGDVDGDGHADVVVGSYTYSGAGIVEGGRITVFGGRDGRVLQRADGSRARGQFGFDAAGLSDVDADGRIDYVVASAPANAVDIVAGTVVRAPLIAMNAGLTGIWSVKDLAGQGFAFDVQPAQGYVAGGGFTHATLAPAAGPEQRWATLLGPIVNDVAQLTITYTRGGTFDGTTAPAGIVVGTARLRFTSCTTGFIELSIRENAIRGTGAPDQGPFLAVDAELQRLTPDSLCATLSKQAQ